MTSISTFADLRAEIFRLYASHDYAAALDLLQPSVGQLPEHEGLIRYWQLCFYSLAGRTDEAVGTLAAALDHGHWYSERMLRSDNDLKPLNGLPEFERLVEICHQRHHEAEASTVPFRLNLKPASSPPHPLLIALHGNNSSAAAAQTYWQPAVKHGWQVMLPQARQMGNSYGYRWDDHDQATRELQQHYREVVTAGEVDPARVVVGGFSMGARLAIMLALSGALPVRGLIAAGSALREGADHWLPYLDATAERGLKVLLIVGDQDNPEHIYEPTRALAALMTEHGITCQLKVYPGLDHDLPGDFAEVLAQALDWMGA